MKNKKQARLSDIIYRFGPCSSAEQWLKDKTVEEAFNTCNRADWFLWLYYKSRVDMKDMESLRHFILVKGKIAETIKHLLKDKDSIKAVEAAIAFGEGKISKDALHDASLKAYAAYNLTGQGDRYGDAAYAAADATNLWRHDTAGDAASALRSIEYNSVTGSGIAKRYADICRKYLPLEIWKF